MSVARVTARDERADRIGALASTLCAVHCAVAALLPVAFGALGLGFLLGHEAEWIFTMIAIAFATAALVAGWRRHRSRGAALLLLLGIVGLLVSRGLEAGGEHGEGGHGHGGEAEHHGGEAEHHDGEAGHHDGEAGHHDDEAGHLLGTVVGVGAGLMLLAGHLVSLRATRRCAEECCP